MIYHVTHVNPSQMEKHLNVSVQVVGSHSKNNATSVNSSVKNVQMKMYVSNVLKIEN